MVRPSFILLPLYVYPVAQNGASTWSFLFDTLGSYPDLNFNIIINENSGPEPVDANGCPTDTNFLAAIANLTVFPNAHLLGYSRIGYTARNISEIKNEIAIYNEFSRCPTHDIHMDGIFFDEAPQNFNATTSKYMKHITNYARSTSKSITGSSFFPIIFNPGTPADSGFFKYADNIVMREDVGSDTYNVTEAINTIPKAERSKSSLILYDWTSLTKRRQKKVADKVVKAGVGGFFITPTEYASVNNDTLWPALLKAMNKFV